jgi:hypothetical protein
VTLLATPALVRSKVASILGVAQHARVIAISASPVWTHEERVALPGDRIAVVRRCVSALAVHDQLSRVDELAEDEVLVLLTDADSRDLGEGVTARLAGQKVFALDRWQQLTELFRARQIDPAIVAEEWAVEALLTTAPPDGYSPASGGYLDRETAFGALAYTRAGLTGYDLDLAGLLQWSLEPEHIDRWQSLDEGVRDGLTRWLTARGERSEPVAAVLRCFAGPYGGDTVALGLVLGALSQPDVASEAGVPRTILETRALGGALAREVAAGWGRAAEGLMRRLLQREFTQGPREAAAGERNVTGLTGRVLGQAEKFLNDAGAVPLAYPSEVLEAALDQQIRAAGTLAGQLVAAPRPDPQRLAALEQALTRLQSHVLVPRHQERVRRAEMAVRLVRWLSAERDSPAPPARSLAEAARRQQDTGAWVDVARARVWEGDVDAEVARAYRRLCAATDAARAEHEHAFARLLADHAQAGSTLGELLPVEDVLATVVEPLGQNARVLLLVLDGASTAIARELLADLSARGWVEHALAPARPVIAALPSVTRASRTSLLCGRLADGTQDDEKAAFVERGWPLFHKADLSAAGAGDALAAAVARAIRGKAPVAGIVINTVDDTLDKGGRTPWTAESVDRLLDILAVAREADRLVLLVSDHGHVHERGSRLERDTSGGARWRSSPRPAGEDEVELTGQRVLLGDGRVVAAWNERLRYGPAKNGYHGGASAQEVVIPLALLARAELSTPGWAPHHHPEPGWWFEAPAAQPRQAPPARAKAGKPRTTAPPEAPALFAAERVSPDAWIDGVLTSEIMTQRLASRPRGAMPAGQLAALLRVLAQRSGTATRAAVARAIDVPQARVASQIAAAQRVLNIDGYDVLQMEEDTVRLNIELLKIQTDTR